MKVRKNLNLRSRAVFSVKSRNLKNQAGRQVLDLYPRKNDSDPLDADPLPFFLTSHIYEGGI